MINGHGNDETIFISDEFAIKKDDYLTGEILKKLQSILKPDA